MLNLNEIPAVKDTECQATSTLPAPFLPPTAAYKSWDNGKKKGKHKKSRKKRQQEEYLAALERLSNQNVRLAYAYGYEQAERYFLDRAIQLSVAAKRNTLNDDVLDTCRKSLKP
jgi:hypothetical protein